MNILELQQNEKLTAGELKVFETINMLGDKVLLMTIYDIARESENSTATINRLLKKFGYKNFKEFKNKTASIVQSVSKTSYDKHIVELTETFSNNLIEHVATTILNSRMIFVVGFGLSAGAAKEFSVNLNKLDYPSIFIGDSDSLKVLRTLTNSENDLIIYFSYCGEDPATLNIASHLQNKRKQYLITCSAASELAQYCDIVLNTFSKEIDPLFKSRVPLHIIGHKISNTLLTLDTNYQQNTQKND